MAVINQINLVNNVGESETYDIETKITETVAKYIENQNLLSEFEDVTLSPSSATATEMEYDGFLIVNHQATAIGGTVYASVFINGVQFSASWSTTQNVIITTRDTYPIKKGDKVYVTGMTSTTGKCRFFKQRDYSNR